MKSELSPLTERMIGQKNPVLGVRKKIEVQRVYQRMNAKPALAALTFQKLRDCRQQVSGQLAFSYESIYRLQYLLRNIHRSR